MQKILSFCLIAFICQTTLNAQALDDIVKRTTLKERKVLAHAPIREADIMWEKRIWRVIDTREKMNQAFVYPDAPFFQVLQSSALNGDITLYSAENDKFSQAMRKEEIESVFFQSDTIEVYNPETYDPEITVVTNIINWEEIKRFRIKEVWYFDSNTSTLKVRILGIAPLMDVINEDGSFRHEKALFWVYYPEVRERLAREKVYMVGNDATLQTWDDIFQMRYFGSYIYKASNIHDNRLQDIYSGVDILIEADKIKQELFNFEHDLWSY